MSKLYYPYSEVIKKDLGNGVSREILSHSGGLMVVKVSLPDGGEVPTHQHIHEQNTYIMSGEFVAVIGDEEFVCKAGDSIYMPPNVPHNCKCIKAGEILDIFTPIREDFLS